MTLRKRLRWKCGRGPVIPSEAEGPRDDVHRSRHGVPRFRCAPLGMTRKTCRHFLVAFLCGLVASASAQQAGEWEKANEAYAAGRYPEAIERYDGLVRTGETSAALFYNLGNAAFRTDDLGRAILHYERALTLEPHHPEAQTNLRLAQDKARALQFRQSRWDRAVTWATTTQYTAAAAASFWIAAFACAAWLLARRRSRATATCFVFALLTCALALAAASLRETGNSGRARAVIVGKNIEARLATADNAGSVLALPPGSEIKILSMRGDWVYAALPNEARGWIPAQAIERVRL